MTRPKRIWVSVLLGTVVIVGASAAQARVSGCALALCLVPGAQAFVECQKVLLQWARDRALGRSMPSCRMQKVNDEILAVGARRPEDWIEATNEAARLQREARADLDARSQREVTRTIEAYAPTANAFPPVLDEAAYAERLNATDDVDGPDELAPTAPPPSRTAAEERLQRGEITDDAGKRRATRLACEANPGGCAPPSSR